MGQHPIRWFMAREKGEPDEAQSSLSDFFPTPAAPVLPKVEPVSQNTEELLPEIDVEPSEENIDAPEFITQSRTNLFAQTPANQEQPSEQTTQQPGQTDQPNLEHPQNPQASAAQTEAIGVASQSQIRPIQSFEMPSYSTQQEYQPRTPSTSVVFHDLGKMYPDAAIPAKPDGLVIHKAILNDISGLAQLLDWVADGHGVIVNMERLYQRDDEFLSVVSRLQNFIINDLAGQVLKMTDDHLLLLPPGCIGTSGVEMEAFAADDSGFGSQ